MSDEEGRDDNIHDQPTVADSDPDSTRPASPLSDRRDSTTGLTAGQHFGAYRLEQQIGSGGFAEVWKARRLDDGRTLALKVLRGVGNVDAQAVRRFEQEGRLAAALSHPRAVFVYSAEVVDGFPTIAMELMPGGTLQDRVKREGALELGEAVDLTIDILDGLEAAHLLGITHRDIKPANCFLDEEGRARIGDFGISRSLHLDANLTATGSFIGTPAFAAPEQIRGRTVDERTDIYGVGALLYNLLAGRPPFAADSGGDLMAQILTERPAAFGELGLRVPLALQRVVACTLDKDPKRRPPTCDDLRRRLAPYSSREVGPADPLRRLAAIGLDFAILFFSILPISGALTGVGAVQVFRTPESLPDSWRMLQSLIPFIYFLAFEGVWARTPGKVALGLHVRVGGARPGWGALTLRLVVFLGPATLLSYAGNAAMGETGAIIGLLGYAIVVSTMRRSNDWRGVHELASGTRTVRTRARAIGSDTPPRRSEIEQPPSEVITQRGPYQVTREVWRECGSSLGMAHDSALGRDVWIVEGGVGEGPHPTRTSRLRWLRRGDEAGVEWDAFEAPRGESLRARIERAGPAGWDEVRRWLRELVEELAMSLEQSDLPPRLSVDRLWLDSHGTLRLLPFALRAPTQESGISDGVRWPEFLHEVALFCLGGMASVPEHAGRVLQSLPRAEADLATARRLAAELVAAGNRRATLGRQQRVRHLGYTYWLPWTIGSLWLLAPVDSDVKAKLNLVSLPVLPFALVSIASAFVVRGGPAMYLFGMTLRQADGEPARRWRSGARALVAWSPLLLQALPIWIAGSTSLVASLKERAGDSGIRIADAVGYTLGYIMGYKAGLANDPVTSWIGLALLLLFVAGAFVAVRRPERGWQDLIAGTRIVPR